jgi:hypothetical protein
VPWGPPAQRRRPDLISRPETGNDGRRTSLPWHVCDSRPPHPVHPGLREQASEHGCVRQALGSPRVSRLAHLMSGAAVETSGASTTAHACGHISRQAWVFREPWGLALGAAGVAHRLTVHVPLTAPGGPGGCPRRSPGGAGARPRDSTPTVTSLGPSSTDVPWSWGHRIGGTRRPRGLWLPLIRLP